LQILRANMQLENDPNIQPLRRPCHSARNLCI